MHDESLALIASFIGRIQTIPEQLVSYRIHRNQSVESQSGLREQWRQARKIMTPDYFAKRIVRTQALVDAVTKLEPFNELPSTFRHSRTGGRPVELACAHRITLDSRLFRGAGMPQSETQWRILIGSAQRHLAVDAVLLSGTDDLSFGLWPSYVENRRDHCDFFSGF
jgi:hypothetical protein